MLRVRHEVATGRVVVRIEGVLDEGAAALLGATVALLPPEAAVVLEFGGADAIPDSALVKLAGLFESGRRILLKGPRPEHAHLLGHLRRSSRRWPDQRPMP